MRSPLSPERVRQLDSTSLLGDLDPADRASVYAQLVPRSLAAGETLFRQGDAGDSFFIVTSGRLAITDESDVESECELGTAGPGDFLGETALLGGGRVATTVRALVASEVLSLSRERFERWIDEHPRIHATLLRTAKARQSHAETHRYRPPTAQLLAYLAASPLFKGIDIAQLQSLEMEVEWRSLPAGELLFRQGAEGDALYLVVHGRLRALVDGPDGVPKTVGEVAAGETVGELALLRAAPRSATVRALRDTDLIRISRAALDQLVESAPKLATVLLRASVTRVLGDGTSAQRESVTIALVPTSPGVRLREWARDLERALAGLTTVARVTSASLNEAATGAQASSGDFATRSVTRRLNELEATHRFVLYECDPTATGWSRRCLRQADRVLLVADSRLDPGLGELEQELVQLRGDDPNNSLRSDLVLLHPAGTPRPWGTKRWLARRRVSCHHHVREGDAAGVERLARRLVGRSLGLVMGGGGARGFAHIGAWRAMVEAGVKIDRIGGTSAGAIVGGMIAAGLTVQETRDAVRKMLYNWTPVTNLTLPVLSICEGGRVYPSLHEALGDVQIEDLWTDFYCVSTNLTAGRTMVHRTGPLWQWIRASMSIPGISPPLILDGELIIDGGLMDNLPADVMQQQDPGPMIVVDVEPSADLRLAPELSDDSSKLKLLWHQVRPSGPRAPNLFDIIYRTVTLGNLDGTLRARRDAAVLIRPSVAEFGILEFRALDRIIQRGYEDAAPKIASWLARSAAEQPAESVPSTASDPQADSSSPARSRRASTTPLHRSRLDD